MQAGVLNVLVTATTGQANAALRSTSAQFKSTATTAQSSAATTRKAWMGAAAGLGLLAVAAGKMSVDFSQSMTLIETQAGAPRGEIERLRGEVLKLAKASEFSPDELAKGLFRVESAGFRGSKAMELLNQAQHLASVGQSDLEATTYALTAAMNTGIRGTETAAKTVGLLNAAVGQGNMRMEDLTAALGTGIVPTAKAFGLQLQDVTSALDLMTRTGVPARAAATRLRMTFSLMGAPTAAAADELKNLGIDSLDMAKLMSGPGGLVSAVQLLHDHLEGLSPEKQAQAITKAFGGGRTSAGIISLVQNVDTLRDIFKATTEQAGTFHEKVVQQSETASSKLARAWSKAQVMLIELGDHLAGPVSAGVLALVTGVDELVGVLGSIPGPAKMVIGVMLATVAVMKIVTVIIGSAFVEAIVGAIAAVWSFIAGTAALIAEMGLFSGAWAAMSILMASNPFVAAAIGVGLLAGAVVGLVSVFGGLFSSEQQLNPIRQRLIETSGEMTDAMDREREAVAGLEGASARLQRAHRKEHDATKAVTTAEKNLKGIRAEYPANSQPVLEAEAALVVAKRKEQHATKRLNQAEREHGVVADALKPVLKDSLGAVRDRVSALHDEHDRIVKNLRQTPKTIANADVLAKLTKRLAHNEDRLTDAHKEEAKVLKDASEKIGPKFAKQIDQTIVSQDHLTRASKDFSHFMANPYKNDLFKGIGVTKDLGREQTDLGGDFKKTRRVGTVAIRGLAGQMNNILGQLGVEAIDMGVGHQTGGFVEVQGHGSGDKVPVHAMVEPGEVLGVLNRNAAREWMGWNNEYPRWSGAQTGGIVDRTGVVHLAEGGLAFALGPHTVPPIQYDPLHAGSNSHVHISGQPPAWVVAIGHQLQQMGNLVGENPAFGGVTPGAHANYGVLDHYHGGAIDVNDPAGDEDVSWVASIARILGGSGIGGGAAAERLKRALITGAEGTKFQELAQAAADHMRKEMDKYIVKKTPTGMGESGAGFSTSASGHDAKRMQQISRERHWSFPDWWEVDRRETGHGTDLLNESSGAALRGQFMPGITQGHYGPGSSPWLHPTMDQQIDSMALYIGERYGNTTAALAHHDAWNWYQRGGARGGGIGGTGVLGPEHGGSGHGPSPIVRAELMIKKIHKQMGKIARLDERVDVAERLASLDSGPSGSDLSVGEMGIQQKLLRKLLDRLRTVKDIDKQGIKMLKMSPKHLKGLDKDDLAKIKNLTGQFDTSLEEMQGLTGSSGRIFDTIIALKELQVAAAGAGAVSPMTVPELLAFAEAVRFGAFNSQFPAFAAGGIHSGGLALVGERGPEIANMPSGTRVYNNQESQSILNPVLHADVYIGGERIDERVEAQFRKRDGRTRAKFGAGRVPR